MTTEASEPPEVSAAPDGRAYRREDRLALAGKTAVVTGGSRGIGRAVVTRLAQDGAQVVFGYLRDTAAARKVEQTVASRGGTAHAVQADLAEPGGVATLFSCAERYIDGLDILVNNAAGAFTPTVIADVTDEDYDRLMAVNTKAIFTATRYAARNMRDGGRIVAISTLNTILPVAGCSLYCASKGAVEQLTVVAARELGPRGITVNTVSPGPRTLICCAPPIPRKSLIWRCR